MENNDTKNEFTFFKDVNSEKPKNQDLRFVKMQILKASIHGKILRVIIFYAKFLRWFNLIEPFFRIGMYVYVIYKILS